MQWFYIHNDARFGPVEESELFRLAREGQLASDDLVWNPTMDQQWMPASSVPGLFTLPTTATPAIHGITPNHVLMQRTLKSLHGCWAAAVGATLLYQLIMSGGQAMSHVGSPDFQLVTSLITLIVILLISGPMFLGWNWFFLKIARSDPPDVGCLFAGFKRFGRTLGAYLLITLFISLWSLLLLVPAFLAGITVPLFRGTSALIALFVPLIVLLFLLAIALVIRATLAYSQTFFILADHPDVRALEAIQLSKHLMTGCKWKKFCLGWRFIGWALLAVFTCGIGVLWLYPYIMTSNAHFYDDIRGGA